MAIFLAACFRLPLITIIYVHRSDLSKMTAAWLLLTGALLVSMASGEYLGYGFILYLIGPYAALQDRQWLLRDHRRDGMILGCYCWDEARGSVLGLRGYGSWDARVHIEARD